MPKLIPGIEPTNEKVVFNVTKSKLERIDNRVRSSGARSRSDYIRKLVDNDLESSYSYKEVSTSNDNTK